MEVKHLVKELFTVCNVARGLRRHELADALFTDTDVLGEELLVLPELVRFGNEQCLLELRQVLLALFGSITHALHVFLKLRSPVGFAVLGR